MKSKDICVNCGHDKWSHAISLKGEVGACMKETIKEWSWCSCTKYVEGDYCTCEKFVIDIVTEEDICAVCHKHRKEK